MSKRFVDTNMNREPWYRKLKPKLKCAVRFLFEECNNAGVWVIDMETMSYFIGEEVSQSELFEYINSDKTDRIEMLGNDKIWIPGFVYFQYGELSPTCKPHHQVVILLNKYGLFERVCKGYSKGIHTLEEKDKDKDKDKEEEERGYGGKQKSGPKPKIIPKKDSQTELKTEYNDLVKNIQDSEDSLAVWNVVKIFIQEKKPEFIEPYLDAWNVYAGKYKLPSVQGASPGRVNKFKTRIREPDFDFLKILEKIAKSEYLKGNIKDWNVDWDWIFENDTNYYKILEGKYK